MKRTAALILAILATLMSLSSCEWLSSLIHDDEVVARLGKRKLYRADLAPFIPADVSPEDSAAIARQYITTWAKEQLYMDVAEQQLSKSESDVRDELEDYRRSLLKYRYEKQYIADRLDTLITYSEAEEYYKSHPDLFVLRAPIVRARFLDIMKESPARETIRRKMSSKEWADLAAADSMAYLSALKYEDRSDEWVDMPVYARNFGYDYGTVLSRLRPDGYIEFEEEAGDIKIGYVVEILRASEIAPLEYCLPRIRDIILSNRKHALLASLEQDLLSDALETEKLIIY